VTASSDSKPNTSQFELLLVALLLGSPQEEEFSPNFMKLHLIYQSVISVSTYIPY